MGNTSMVLGIKAGVANYYFSKFTANDLVSSHLIFLFYSLATVAKSATATIITFIFTLLGGNWHYFGISKPHSGRDQCWATQLLILNS